MNNKSATTRTPWAEGPIADHAGAPILSCNGSTWTMRFNRPAAHNRLDPLDVDAMLALFTITVNAGSGQPTALVITGNEARSFSSGYTLDAITSELDSRFEQMLDALETLPFLTIAAINGNIFGGATDLALCCDIRVGQTDSRMLMPAANFGLHYYTGGLRRYVNRLGLTTASRLMLTGLPMPSDDMLRVGFLTDLVEPANLMATVNRYTEAAQKTEPIAVAKMKAAMAAIANTIRDDTALSNQIQAAYDASKKSPELAERVNTLLSKKS